MPLTKLLSLFHQFMTMLSSGLCRAALKQCRKVLATTKLSTSTRGQGASPLARVRGKSLYPLTTSGMRPFCTKEYDEFTDNTAIYIQIPTIHTDTYNTINTYNTSNIHTNTHNTSNIQTNTRNTHKIHTKYIQYKQYTCKSRDGLPETLQHRRMDASRMSRGCTCLSRLLAIP